MVFRFTYWYHFLLVLVSILIIISIFCGITSVSRSHSYIPKTGDGNGTGVFLLNDAYFPFLHEFIERVINEDSRHIAGVYVADQFAFRVIEQPSGNSDYVSLDPYLLTEYSLAERFGTHGILAHNYLAGKHFFDLEPGMQIIVVYADGKLGTFEVVEAHRFQALSPENVHSDFVALDGKTRTYSSTELFYKMYNNPGDLVLQTCIEKDGEWSWGRYFVIAEKMNEG